MHNKRLNILFLLFIIITILLVSIFVYFYKSYDFFDVNTKFHIFTFATDKNRLSYLEETDIINNNNVNYIIMDKWNSFYDKLYHMRNALENLPLDDIVCFIDGYDVLINSDNKNIVDKFMSYDCGLLLGVELNCYPINLKDKMDEINTNTVNFYKYINSGGYIGYNKDVLDMLNWKEDNEIIEMCKQENGGDQAYVMKYYINNYKNINIKLDIYCKLFQNMYWVSWDDFIFKNGVGCNIIMDVNPCFFHFNGESMKTETGENIMPIFIKKIEDSKNTNDILNLHDIKQFRTKEHYPRKQK